MKIKANDWHKSFHDRELVEATPLTAEERGCYYTIRNLIFKELGHVINSDEHLGGWCKVKPKPFAKIKARLIASGCLYVDGTSLRSRTADSVIADRMAKRQKAQKSGRAGGKAKADRERTKPDTVRNRAQNARAPTEPDENPQLFEDKGISSGRYHANGTENGHNSGAISDISAEIPISTTSGGTGQVPEKQRKRSSKRHHSASDSLGESKSLRKEEVKKDSDSLVDAPLDDLTEDAVGDALAAYNDVAGEGNDWPKATAMTPKRKRALAKLLNTEGTGGLTGWRAMLKLASESDWLAGRTTRRPPHENWRASLDYFARLDVFVEVMEGKHGNRNRSGKRDGASAMGDALKRFLEEDAGG